MVSRRWSWENQAIAEPVAPPPPGQPWPSPPPLPPPRPRPPLTRVAARLPLPGRIPPFRVRTGRASILRVGIGVALVMGGATTFLAVNGALAAVRQGLVATAGIVGGIALIFGPWWWRLGKEL